MDAFRLDGRIAIITGGAGLMGVRHAEAIAECGGVPILWDIDEKSLKEIAPKLAEKHNCYCHAMKVDITDLANIRVALDETISITGKVNILINNAARDPKIGSNEHSAWSRFENFSPDMWEADLAVGLTGAFLCSQAVGNYMANCNGGVILNIASDLGVIAPDQRIYHQPDLPDDQQPVKPVTYSVIKHGLIGLTKYLATYWADQNVRVNAISPGSIFDGQSDDFVMKFTNLIPMGRMASKDEYKASIVFLVSDASSYMTGANLIIDGGRTCW